MWDYSNKKQTSLTLQCRSLIFISRGFCKGFFVLNFIVNICSISWYKVHYFTKESWYLFISCLFWLWLFNCLKIRISLSLFFLVSLCFDYQRHWENATHDDIVPLPRKQPRCYLWTFCCLYRRDQGLFTQSLGFIRFTVFKL